MATTPRPLTITYQPEQIRLFEPLTQHVKIVSPCLNKSMMEGGGTTFDGLFSNWGLLAFGHA
jgi:hypothetical protein